MREIIGTYIEITITNNNVDASFYNNKVITVNNSLYDNAKCYTEHSVPTFSRDDEILKLFRHICSLKKCKDKTLFFALGDFPIIMKDRKKHPHYDRCLGDYDVYPKYLKNVFSRSIIPNIHDDLLFPTRDYINAVLNLDNIESDINYDFYNKKTIAIFRGTRWQKNNRIQKQCVDY